MKHSLLLKMVKKNNQAKNEGLAEKSRVPYQSIPSELQLIYCPNDRRSGSNYFMDPVTFLTTVKIVVETCIRFPQSKLCKDASKPNATPKEIMRYEKALSEVHPKLINMIGHAYNWIINNCEPDNIWVFQRFALPLLAAAAVNDHLEVITGNHFCIILNAQ